MNTEFILWIVSLIAFIVVEAVTAQLVTIWFAAGALCALVAEVLDAPLWLQLTIFVVVSAITLAATRPLVKKMKSNPSVSTNADSIIGQKALVTEDIDNLAAKGRADINGMSWSARSEDNTKIPAGTEVVVRRIEGVKLIVK
ncbi:MAG: NfeD family protein [Clostridia bacterium]|nr:NfeD family protein [Clostridia bacterium]